ncbi:MULTISPECIES: hypothetical protein [Flavobacterium]|uniref:hypothetical protein n=1 Tax=Flavobacterium TaxID=237 RepID=UPI0011A260AC|nr:MULTISPECIES: hypothetical protein [Flavobacterium]QZK91567.1 hypothetical protein K5V07_14080 [Flavobacterium sp. CHNK8]
MKQLSNKYHLSFVLTFAFVIFAKAQPPPPPPPGAPPPVFPIDDCVFVVMILAVFLGIYLIIYNTKKPLGS